MKKLLSLILSLALIGFAHAATTTTAANAPPYAGPVYSSILTIDKTAPTISTNTLTLDLNTGTVYAVALTANITTLTVSNWPASGKASSYILQTTANGTPYTITWPGCTVWINNGGAAPTPSSTNGKRDLYQVTSWDGGTTCLTQLIAANY